MKGLKTQRRKPHISINMIMSADGKISSASGESATVISSREDQELLQKIRSRGDALVVGARTAKDYLTMGIASAKLRRARVLRGQQEHPLRVIISGKLNLSASLRLFSANISPIILVCTERASKDRIKLFSRHARVVICGKDEIDILKLIRFLSKEYQVNRIVSEGGPTLNDAFFRAEMVDDLFVTLSPSIIGGKSALTVSEGKGILSLKKALRGKVVSLHQGEKEWFLQVKFSKK